MINNELYLNYQIVNNAMIEMSAILMSLSSEPVKIPIQ